jgi:hypothetical protein
MIPGCCADERLEDQALDIDEGGDLLRILAVQVGQEAYQREVHVTLAGLGPKRMLLGHHAVTQTIHYGVEHVGGNEAVPPQCRLPLCPRQCHHFASSTGLIDMGY